VEERYIYRSSFLFSKVRVKKHASRVNTKKEIARYYQSEQEI